ncbi:MAG: MMPL family transporter [Ketobacteraceae bacterium]|nr:MMPL family transporter [Ketobacteraceae bacterium]
MPYPEYSQLLIQKHKSICVAIFALLLAIGFGIKSLNITTDLRIFFSDDNPQLQAFNAYDDSFTQRDILQFLIVAEDQDVFTPDSLRLIKTLTGRSWTLPYTLQVSSLSNWINTEATGDEVHSYELVSSDFDYSPPAIDRLKAITERESLHQQNLISSGHDAALVVVSAKLPPSDMTATLRLMEQGRLLAEELEVNFPGHHIHLSGSVAMNSAFIDAIEQDMSTYVGLSYVVILAVLVLLIRSVSGVAIALIIISSSVVIPFGIFGWLGITLTPSVGLVPTMIMTIAVADVIHLLSSYYGYLYRGESQHNAIKKALESNRLAIFITSLTTAVGFLVLNFHESPPHRMLGNLVAIGVTAAYLLTMVLVPAWLAWWGRQGAARSIKLDRPVTGLTRKALKNPHTVLAAFCGSILLFLVFAPQNRLVEDWNNQFDQSFDIRKAVDANEKYMGGAHYLYYLLESRHEGGVTSPEFIKEIKAFSDWYLEQPEVTSTEDLAKLIARLNRVLNEDADNKGVLPDSSELISQYLMVHSMSLPFGAEPHSLVSLDGEQTQLIVSTRKLDSERLLELDERARQWLANNTKWIKDTEATGIDMILSHSQQRNIPSTVYTSILALCIVSGILVLVFRSLRVGLLSLIPNLAPAVLAYGAWNLMHGELNLSAAMVMTMSLGIVVDDTVHYMTRYLRARKAMSPESAAIETAGTVGVAMVMTTLVLVLGFAMTIGSGFEPTRHAGALMTMTLSFALLLDLILLPVLLVKLDRFLRV